MNCRLQGCLRRVALAGALAVSSAGCWDLRTLDQRAFALLMAIDRQEGQWQLTAQIAVPGGQDRGGGAEGTPAAIELVSGRGNSLREALDDLRSRLHRELDTSHMDTVVIGEAAAREGLDRLLFLSRSLRVPVVASVAVSRGPAAEVTRARSPALNLPALFTARAFTGSFTRHPGVIPVPVWMLFNRLLPSPFQDPYAPGLVSREGQIDFAGVALFSGPRMVGWLDGHDAATLGVIRARRVVGSVSADVPAQDGQPGGRTVLRVVTGRIRYSADLRDGRPVLRLNASFHGDLDEAPPGLLRDAQGQARVEQALARESEARLESLLHRLQEIGSDPIGFGEDFRVRWPDSPFVRDKASWQAAYRQAEVEARVDISITSSGHRE
ncbi:Ger(x)C family spore germination protein [Caldinitratiruptor microaerophilus]|uniref:Spore germination protein B3 n=1 Tax=Caldinitratiruptor microaerophilus TaxID=671077 RepID=A0AA35CIU0_9FIRM|nr:Ger(x)C family spore germination protein [Caldinitratiruptor microaerophilus]BDG59827.1 spore germination protein B3 [Caldinitratiruptor microaerophilus]